MSVSALFQKRRVLTGIRPTGPLHLGHYVGALKQWIPLQDHYECFFLIADIQAMTTHANQPELIQWAVREIVLDWMAVGLNPQKKNVHFVLQSQIPELNVLYTLFSMVTPLTWIEHNPTIKAEMKSIKDVTLGFYDYPVSQAADITLVSYDPLQNASKILVPVGEDQIPHLESTNSVVKAFHRTYGKVFSLCEPLVGVIGRLVGTDGSAKMSKSQGNCIYLGDSADVVRNRVMKMFTDPNRIHPSDPGTVEGNPVFMYLDAFDPDKSKIAELKSRYRKGTVGDVEVKKILSESLNSFLEPIRQRRAAAAREPIGDYLQAGTRKARKIGKMTVDRALAAAKLNYSDLNR